MKKLSSMLALGLALALTLGMTVSAAESPTTEGAAPEMKEGQIVEYTEKSEALTQAVGEVTTTVGGQAVTLEKAPVAPETLLQAEMIATNKAAEAAGALKLPEGKTVESTKVVGSADITLPEGTAIPEEGITLEIPISGITAGKTYVLLHLTGGKWETIVPSSVANGKVTATFKSLSPIVASEVIIAEVSEDSDDDSDDTNSSGAPAAANPATSPKTAETLPVAGVMTLICLVGAAVCANKIRYNK